MLQFLEETDDEEERNLEYERCLEAKRKAKEQAKQEAERKAQEEAAPPHSEADLEKMLE